MSCEWKHVSATNPCLGNPWDEIMGFERPLDQTKETKRKVRFSNEQAVGLRAHDEKYTKETKLRDKRYKSKRLCIVTTRRIGTAWRGINIYLCAYQG